MGYHARIEPAGAARLIPAPATREQNAPDPGFTELEWSIIKLARLDRLWTLRPTTRLRRFFNRLIGRNPNPGLANPRLETLRRISVLSWHFGFTVPSEDVAEFIGAGFSLDQYELLVTSIRRLSSSFIPFQKAGNA